MNEKYLYFITELDFYFKNKTNEQELKISNFLSSLIFFIREMPIKEKTFAIFPINLNSQSSGITPTSVCLYPAGTFSAHTSAKYLTPTSVT